MHTDITTASPGAACRAPRRRLAAAAVVAAAGLGLGACSASGSAAPSPGRSTPAAGGASAASAAPTESNPPGDIPDTTIYVPYRAPSGLYEVKVPEGWARTGSAARVTFTSKLNSVRADTVRASAAPTTDTARTTEVPPIQASGHKFQLTDIRNVSRRAGTVVEIRYLADSSADPVTGKVVRDAVERYEYYRDGTEAILTLTGPAGADNVDPWRTVTDSFRWLK